jgi:hypothetical protein
LPRFLCGFLPSCFLIHDSWHSSSLSPFRM